MAKRIKLPTRPERYIVDPNVGIIPTATISRPEREKQERVRREPPTMEEWLSAANNRSPAQASISKAEVDSNTVRTTGTGDVKSQFSIQKTLVIDQSKEESGIVLRVGPSPAALAVIAAGGTWNVFALIREGFKGSIFRERQVFVPLVGAAYQLRGDFAQATIVNSSGLAEELEISAELEQGHVRENKIQRTRQANVQVTIPEFTKCYSVSVNGGVQMGDLVVERDAAGVAIHSYPAREGGLWWVTQTGARLSYTQAAGGPPSVVWGWVTEK